MLVAKYVKVFSRTGTQPFQFTCHAWDKHRAPILKVCEQFAAHCRRDHIRARYLTDTNILSCLGRWHPCLPAFRGFSRVAAHGDRFPASNFPLQKGKEPFKKYTSGQMRTP